MKQQIYTLHDHSYLALIGCVLDALETAGAKPVIVGGLAVQIHLFKMLGQDAALRPTDDIDLLVTKVNRSLEQVFSSLNGAEYLDGNSISLITVARNGKRRPVFLVESVDDENFLKFCRIKLNISWSDEHLYHIKGENTRRFIESSKCFKLVINEKSISVRVLSLEHLLATKITALREKDFLDVSNLINAAASAGVEIDFHEIEQIISGCNQERRSKATHLFRSLKNYYNSVKEDYKTTRYKFRTIRKRLGKESKKSSARVVRSKRY